MARMKIDTVTLAGTAILSALVVVFDYTMKYSGLKIVFPLLPFLRFDFTGVPIVLSFLLFGLIPGIFTSIISSVAILIRSGQIVSASLKGVAEFLTVLGMMIGLKLFKKYRKTGLFTIGIGFRAVIMIIVNLALIYLGIISLPPSYVEIPLTVGLLFGIFNAIQGILSVSGGYFIYEAIKKRLSINQKIEV